MKNRISSLLQNNTPCSCGKSHPISLSALVIEAGALDKLPQVIADLGTFSSVVMICDTNTYAAAGKKVAAVCNLARVVCLDVPQQGFLHATETAVETVETLMGNPDLLLAVGSGTIHDITRYVAYKHHLDFVSVPTAASVDGFLSSIAAMTWHGVKRSFPAKSPVALVADSLVLTQAPYRLTASGVGDLLGKYVCLFDWKASHLITGEYICHDIISLVEKAVSAVVDNPDLVASQSLCGVEMVMYGLVLSGLAMQMVGNSRPASGAEHHISHMIEMEVLSDTQGNEALHGEKVGVASVLVANRYRQILTMSQADLTPIYPPLPTERITEVFGHKAQDIISSENTPDPLSAISLDRLLDCWEDLKILARKTLPTGDTLACLLKRMGAPTTLQDIDIPPHLWDTLWEMSPYVRRRLTFMRMVKLLGK